MHRSEFYELIPRNRLIEVLDRSRTPCYLYFLGMVRRRVEDLRHCLPNGFTVNYAVKANPNKEIIACMARLGLGADVASGGELERALAAGMAPRSIEFTGPGKSDAELEAAVGHGISSIDAESVDEVRALLAKAQSSGRTVNVGLRINPGPIPTRKPGIVMGGESQFGMPFADVTEALEIMRSSEGSLLFNGIHVHVGSQLLEAEDIVNNVRVILELALRVSELGILEIRRINFGGGWGICYFKHQSGLDLEKLRMDLKQLFAAEKYRELLAGTRLIVEPGRFLVGECGVYVSTVLYVKGAWKRNFAVVDGGMHQNYLLAGGIGQVIKRNFELDIVAKGARPESRSVVCDVVGCLCTPQDLLASEVAYDGGIRPRDLVVFFNSGAYGYSASPLHFLGHDLPDEVVVP